ncbi:hypothetical protein T265_09124 [Opisthorchis viverrini]|uniref:Uncharacterized protein n=1 Tax=Opisthorchis viverrini TaxID=6198 RepID=A0A074Z6Y0_OPIVI|nr:hypothetical protein T265_09124 [Opisthorchis viverrini]KER22848.1 hypothetical protein T265_09124 [Opisthorchis viverrini]
MHTSFQHSAGRNYPAVHDLDNDEFQLGRVNINTAGSTGTGPVKMTDWSHHYAIHSSEAELEQVNTSRKSLGMLAKEFEKRKFFKASGRGMTYQKRQALR